MAVGGMNWDKAQSRDSAAIVIIWFLSRKNRANGTAKTDAAPNGDRKPPARMRLIAAAGYANSLGRLSEPVTSIPLIPVRLAIWNENADAQEAVPGY